MVSSFSFSGRKTSNAFPPVSICQLKWVFAAVRPQLGWDAVLQPLIDFCREPWHAADRGWTGSGAQSLPALRLVSQVNALRRDVNARDQQIARLGNTVRQEENTIADLERKALVKDVEIANLRNELERRQQARKTRSEEWQTTVESLRSQLGHLQQTREAENQQWRQTVENLQQAKDAQIAHLQQTIEEIQQGRVMRLLNGINHILKGNPLE